MTPKYTKIAAVAAGAMLAIGGVAVAANAADPTATPSASSSASPSGGTVTTSGGATTDDCTTEGHGKGGRGGGMGRADHSHTVVTGDEATKVTNAVEAKDSGYTVTSVQKDDDDSYDVHATKADGTTVMLEVSADLTTIEERVRGDR